MDSRSENPASLADHHQVVQHYSLRWSDFRVNLVRSFDELQKRGDFVDVTLAADGISVSVHKLVLCACSPYFEKLLKSNPCQHPVVILQNVPAKSLRALVTFMYSGQVHVPQTLLAEFLKTAQLLQIRGLTEEDASSDAAVMSADNDLVLADLVRTQLDNTTHDEDNHFDNQSKKRFISREVRATIELTEPLQAVPSTKRFRHLDMSGDTPVQTLAPPQQPHSQSPNDSANAVTNVVRDDDNDAKECLPALENEDYAENMQRPRALSTSASPPPLPNTVASSDALSPEDQTPDAAVASNLRERLSIERMSVMDKLAGLEKFTANIDKIAIGATGNTAMSSLLGLPNFAAAAAAAAAGFHTAPPATTPPALSSSPATSSISVTGETLSPALDATTTGGVYRRGMDMYRLRATDPRPCTICGKTYKNAHTLRTHMEDKHSQCAGFRCVLCGTVAKSRNSLHSHMSRQHRGVSTRDLPLLPMPAPWDPSLAAQFIARSGGRGEVVRQQHQAAVVSSRTGSRDKSLNNSPAHSPPPPTPAVENGGGVTAARAAAAAAYQRQLTLMQRLAAQQRSHAGAVNSGNGAAMTGSAVLDTYLQLMVDQGVDLSLAVRHTSPSLADNNSAMANGRLSEPKQILNGAVPLGNDSCDDNNDAEDLYGKEVHDVDSGDEASDVDINEARGKTLDLCETTTIDTHIADESIYSDENRDVTNLERNYKNADDIEPVGSEGNVKRLESFG